MARGIMLACLAVAAFAAVVDAQTLQSPTYQRRPLQRQPQRFRAFPRFAAPAVQAGTFQRPYPYHLDYYRKVYGGGYEPYLGNLYGPPAVVGQQPFAFSTLPDSVRAAAPAQGPPTAEPIVTCPHCQQAFALPAPPVEGNPR